MTDDTTLFKTIAFYLMTSVVKLIGTVLWKPIIGKENLPDGAYIIAINHRSLIDGVVVVNEFNRIRRRPIHVIVFKEAFDKPVLWDLMKLSGCIPFDRGDEASRLNILETSLGYLKAGEPVGIFPEAHLSIDGKMRRARPGAAMLAIESGVPVVPVGLKNTEKVLEPGTGKFRIGTRITIEVGKPLLFSNLKDDYVNSDKKGRMKILKEVSGKIMTNIAKLSGQQYPFAKAMEDKDE